MEQFLRKFQNSGKITWTRVKRSNGKYGYVRTKNERPVDFDEYTGKFKMYDLPDTNSNWLEVSKPGTSSGNIKSIERRPDSHADYIAQQKMVDAQDEAHDLTPIFANLMTAGQAPVVNEGAENIKKGNYLLGASLIASPLMFGSGAVGTAARSGIGLYNLANENGVRKTINNFSEGNYGQGTLSLMGDAFNAAMASEGLGSISNALKGTSGYRNWRLAREINKGIKQKTNKGTYTYEPIIPEKRISHQPKLLLEPSTSLKFFERKPSKLSEAERAGVPRGDRNLPFKPKLPTEHVQGDEAVKMFKEYGGEPIPEGSINGELLRKYVAEARERYGLTKNKNITDEEIAQALYKHSKELGENTAAVNVLGEPQLLFRGDTRRYTLLKERMSPEELTKKSGTMDNSLGNLFLGEFPDSYRGVDRYIGTWRNFNGNSKLIGSGTGSKVVWDGKTAPEIEGFPYLGPLAEGGYKLYSQPHKYGNIDVYKLPASMMESGVNDLNAFIVRTPLIRNATSEISVLNDDWMLLGAKDTHFMSKNYKYNPKTHSMEEVKTGESATESVSESRAAMGDHYKELLKEAEQKQQGLLKSEANAPLRDEHSLYSYFALPNFNIQGAKHLLPYDLRIPRNWKDKNIYRGLIPLTTGYTLYNLFNQPLRQLQYLKQGGKMNILEFLKNGSRIHIKEKNKGSFTRWCGGNVTEECIRRGKNSPNPKIRKKATFADNARHFKHKSGGKAFVEGVNVLDSNPDAYKFLKTKMKVKKHLLGGNFATKVGNFLSSDTGQSLISTGVGLFNSLKLKLQANKLLKLYTNQINSLYKQMKNNIDLNLINLLAALEIANMQAMNPDVHYGTIDLLQQQEKFKREALNKATLEADLWKQNAMGLLNSLVNAIKGSANNAMMEGFGNLLNTGIGLAGNYFKKTPTTSSTPSYTSTKIMSNNFSAPKTDFSVNMKL